MALLATGACVVGEGSDNGSTSRKVEEGKEAAIFAAGIGTAVALDECVDCVSLGALGVAVFFVAAVVDLVAEERPDAVSVSFSFFLGPGGALGARSEALDT